MTAYTAHAVQDSQADRLYLAGYASLFGQIDLSGDVVRPGAFAASILSLGGSPLPMLAGHDTAQPIGAWHRMIEDAKGLYVEGHLLRGHPAADRTARLIEMGAVTGLSIGYQVRRTTPGPSGRILHDLDLWEVSLVAFPMLRGARLTTIGEPNSQPSQLPQPSQSYPQPSQLPQPSLRSSL